MTERVGEAFEFDEKLTVVGAQLKAGDAAPDFTLDHFDAVAGAGSKVSLTDSAGKVRILNVINSIDTPVCNVETHKWEDFRHQQLPADVVVYTVSMDLPFALGRWNQAEGITLPGLSSHKTEQFGRDYGVLIKEWRMLQRSVFVIDRDNKIAYAEYVGDQMHEPDYNAAIEIAKKL